jgi:hypothetical protein
MKRDCYWAALDFLNAGEYYLPHVMQAAERSDEDLGPWSGVPS